ncbi:MAG: glycosidase, partial [Chromatiales bacterium]
MTRDQDPKAQTLPQGVMLNAYPDSIGDRLSDTVALLKKPELAGAFSLFYILPTFFNSDLDRGFSIIDYNRNEALVGPEDLADLDRLGIKIKLDLVLNHLSVRSPQFQDLLLNGEESPYRDFFIDWDKFWEGHGTKGPSGHVVPYDEHLQKLFMRKPGLPTLRVRFPDGTLKTYWNTFYQKVDFAEITAQDFAAVEGLHPDIAAKLVNHLKIVIKDKNYLELVDLEDIARREDVSHLTGAVLKVVCGKRDYLGQL